jgi:perosamine synthetase
MRRVDRWAEAPWLRLPYAYRVPLCVPFWNWRTYAALFGCSVLGRTIDGSSVEALERRLARYYSTLSVVSCGSGRAAIELALRATGVVEGDEVIVPTFCCASIIPPIVAAGAVPVFADVGEDLSLTPETVDAACTRRTRAVIVAHLFGNPAPSDAIGELCRTRALILIDDAAQALGAHVHGRPLGSFGNAGIVSFGSGKVCFGTGGGVLVSHDAGVLARARSYRMQRPAGGETLQRGLSVLLWRRWRRWSLPLHVALSRLRSAPRGNAEYRASAMPNLDAAVALSLMDTLGVNLRARRTCVDAYRREIVDNGRLQLVPHHDGSACLTQVVRLPAGETRAARSIDALRRAGYEVDRSYTPLHLQPQYAAFGPRRSLPNAERVWREVVELPCEPSVKLADIERIARIVRDASNAA